MYIQASAIISRARLLLAGLFAIALVLTSCNEVEEPDSVIYLADNGVTLKVDEWAYRGDTVLYEGETYIIANNEILYSMVENGEDLSKVITSMVTSMSGLFKGRTVFNYDISSWDVSRVTDMQSLFEGSRNFDQHISNWDLSNVISMHSMFAYSDFNQDISKWDMTNVMLLTAMFLGNTHFDQDISDWDVSNITSMHTMFTDSNFNQDISNWDVSRVRYMTSMFKGASSFNQDLSGWDVCNVWDYREFSSGAASWTLPGPDFEACSGSK